MAYNFPRRHKHQLSFTATQKGFKLGSPIIKDTYRP